MQTHHSANLKLNKEEIMVHKGEKKTKQNKDKKQSKNHLKVGHLLKVAKLHTWGPKTFVKRALKLLNHKTPFSLKTIL